MQRSKRGTILECILVFMYIFAFAIKGDFVIESSMIVCLFLTISAIVNKDFFLCCVKLLKTKFVRTIVLGYVVTNLWCVFCVKVNGTNDFTFLKTFLHVFLQISTGGFLYNFLKFRGSDKQIVNYIVVAFIAQTIIQWLAFLLPPVRALVRFTKSADVLEKAYHYGNMRAISLCGSSFFGLSAAYAMIALLFWSKKNTIFNDNRFMRVLVYGVMMSGTFFAGRTGFVGVLMACVYGIVKRLSKRDFAIKALNENEKRTGAFFAAALLVTIIAAGILCFTSESFATLFWFAFEPVYNLITKGTLMISSVSGMLGMFSFVPLKTLLIGDGVYSVGAYYYMGTDIGYYRVIYYAGIIGFALLMFLQLVIVKPKQGEECILKIILLITLLILNLKGEVITWSIIVLAVVLLFCLQDNDNSNNVGRLRNRGDSSECSV